MVYFNLSNIKVNQFAILDPNPTPQGQVISQFVVLADKDSHNIGLQLTCDYKAEDKKFLTLQVTCTFVIKDESWQSWIKDDKVVIPRSFLVHMAMLTFGRHEVYYLNGHQILYIKSCIFR